MSDTSALRKWVSDGEHLPAPLRDFHDQKDFFKSLHDWMSNGNARGVGEDLPNWIAGQIYVIDWFLRFAALHGWTLQRSRKPLTFASLDQTIGERRQREVELFRTALSGSTPSERETPEQEPPSSGVPV